MVADPADRTTAQSSVQNRGELHQSPSYQHCIPDSYLVSWLTGVVSTRIAGFLRVDRWIARIAFQPSEVSMRRVLSMLSVLLGRNASVSVETGQEKLVQTPLSPRPAVLGS